MVEFFDLTGLYDGSWLLFILVAAVSRSYGKNILFKKLQVPTITGYMFIGFLCGPYVLKVLSVDNVKDCGYVNKIALSFIAFSAGAEIHWKEIAPLLKSICFVSAGMTMFTMIIATIFSFGMAGTPLLTWLGELSPSCGVSVSLLVATILSARSPTSVLAVVRELKAKGPVTDMLVAITVGGDIIVLTLFAINLGITRNMCAGLAFDPAAFFLDLALILVAFAMGFVLGWIIIGCLYVPHAMHLILPIGFLTYLICDYILAVTEEEGGYVVGLDALLVCIAAGFVAINMAPHEKAEELLDYLKKYAKYVFIPFFTVVGLSINLPVLIKSLGFSIIACIVRAICMQLGTVTGGHYAKLSREVSCLLWIGLLPQAGVSLGLAGIIAAEFSSTFGSDFQSTLIGIILINQIVGPIGAKYLLKKVKEDGKGEGQLPTTGGMRFIGDLDKPKPKKETQTIDNIEEDTAGIILIGKAREINPMVDDKNDFTTQLLDLVVEKPAAAAMTYFPFFPADNGVILTPVVSTMPDVHNPLFTNGISIKGETIDDDMEVGIEMPDGAIQQEDDHDSTEYF